MNDVMALGATLLHSLWQATLLAAILWFVSRHTRAGAAIRYRLAYGTLLIQLALTAVTFLHYYTPAPRFEGTVKRVMIDFVAAPSATTPDASLLSDPTFWMTALVVCWLVSTLVGTGKLLVSFRRVSRMQRTFGRAISPALSATVQTLAQRIGYRGRLSVRVGEGLSAPVLIGHLRPVLLFPIAIVNQLTTEEAETVILHELAHLRRYDHWFNLLQCIIEVLYYYHPAVHWIAARIREEREYCCDDLVLAYGPGRLPYARALLHYGERAVASPATALSLTDGGGLLARVRRFLHNQQTTYTMNRKLLLLPLLAVGVLISTAAYVPFSEDAKPVLPPSETLAPASPALTDTLPPGDHEATRISDGKVTKVRVSEQQITELKIDGEVIPPEEYGENEGLVEELLGVKPTYRPFDREWKFDFSPDSLHRLAARTLQSVNMDSLMSGLRQRNFQHFPDSSFSKLGKLHQWSTDAEWEADRLGALSADFDSISNVYTRMQARVNLDSLIDAASAVGLESLKFDSLSISWGNRDRSSPFKRLGLQEADIPRRLGESDMEYIERQEEVLLERLKALEKRKRALEERQEGQPDGFGLGRLETEVGSLQGPFLEQRRLDLLRERQKLEEARTLPENATAGRKRMMQRREGELDRALETIAVLLD